MNVKLLAITANSEKLLEYAGRVCYHSKSRGAPGKFLQDRIHDGHESLVEHASATFEISGISRACSHQLVRHRLASYSQESQRYVDMSSPEWALPSAIMENPQARAIWNEIARDVKSAYRALRNLGIRKEDARFVLPNAAATRIVTTMNFRQWRHFFRMRCDKHAQWEIRGVAESILAILYNEAPSVFEDLYETFLKQ